MKAMESMEVVKTPEGMGVLAGGVSCGVKQCTFHWLISDDIEKKEMVLNSLIIHHLIMMTCISYEIILTTSLPKLINIATS